MGVEEVTFVDLIGVEELETGSGGKGERRFMSLRPSFNPGSGAAYGGHVFAQAVWAAAQTVGEGMICHNVHGYFTLPGLSDRPYIYIITPLSSGRSYCTRSITVRQPIAPSPPISRFSGSTALFPKEDANGPLGEPCFAALVSFKLDEKKRDHEMGIGHQVEESVQERLLELLRDVKPEELERCPIVDSPWFYRAISPHSDPHTLFPFPGLEMRKLDLFTHNAPLHPSRWTALHFYRPIGSISTDLPNLHVCAHLYASDRNSLFLVSNAVGFGDEVGNMGSLSHSVVLHVRSEELLLQEGEWYIQEAWTPRSGEGRGMHESRIWDSKGVNLASSWQEGMVRKAGGKDEQRQRLLWEEGMKRLGIPFGEDARRELVDVSGTKAKTKHKL